MNEKDWKEKERKETRWAISFLIMLFSIPTFLIMFLGVPMYVVTWCSSVCVVYFMEYTNDLGGSGTRVTLLTALSPHFLQIAVTI